jgi:hypothetical protein
VEIKKNKTLLEKETEETAYHEAGHAVMFMIVNLKFGGIFVWPSEVLLDFRDTYNGVVTNCRSFQFRRSWHNVMVYQAGLIAEDLLNEGRSALRYVDCTDFDYMVHNAQTVCHNPEEAVLFLKWCHARATRLLTIHWAAVERIAAALRCKPELYYLEALEIFNAAPLRGTDARWEEPIIAP